MKILTLCIVIALSALSALAQTPYDYRQDDDDRRREERFNNYIVADAALSGQVTTELSSIKWILGVIAVAVVGGAVGLIFSVLRKKLSLPAIPLIAASCALLAAIPVQEAECQGGCEQYSCRVDTDCPYSCFCNQYYFTCQSR